MLVTMLEEMAQEGYTPQAIVYSGARSPLLPIQASSQFIPEWKLEGDRPSHFEGTFRNIPVYRYVRGETEFLVLSLTRLGRLSQYLNTDGDVFWQPLVREYSLEEAARFAREDRSRWPHAARDLSEDAFILYLRERVRVTAAEAFSLDIADPSAARIIAVPAQAMTVPRPPDHLQVASAQEVAVDDLNDDE
jgi:hypothetical protein